MRKSITFILTLFFCFLFSQKLSIKQFNKIDFNNLNPLLIYLNSEITNKYHENDTSTYYDNLFRVNIVGKKYGLALKQIDSVRHVYLKSNPTMANAMGSQFEIYLKTLMNQKSEKNFEKKYKEEFLEKFKSLSLKSKLILPRYFSIDANQMRLEVEELLKTKFTSDSIDINDALLLCRKYNSYNVAKESFVYAHKFLKEWDEQNYTVQDSIIIKTKKNHDVSIRIVLNKKIKVPESTIIVNTIYSEVSDINDAKEIASNGYMCVYINTRGKFLGNNKIEPFEHEAEDINEVIDWIIKQPWSNGKVGMIGGSYLGFSQWAATKKLHPALKTIIPQVAVGIGIDYPMVNNVFMNYTLRWLDYVTTNKTINEESFSDEEKWHNIYKNWYINGNSFNKLDSIANTQNDIFQRWLKHPSYDEYWQKMTPYQEEYSKINIPILTTTGYFDDDQVGALYYYKNHIHYNKNANHYLIIGPYNHSGGQGNIKSEIQGLKIDPIANINLNQICFEWFDYILKNKKKPDFLKGKINYEVIGKNIWKKADSFEEFEEKKTRFYINDNFLLVGNQNKILNSFPLKIDFTDRNDVDKQIKYEYNVICDSLLNTGNYLQFTTPIFDKEFEFTGNLSGNLNVSINKKDCDISMYLYEMLPNGKYFLLSNYIGRASYAKDNTIRNLLVQNQKTVISIKNTTYISKKIEKGSKLILLLGVNKTPFWQINYGTGKDVSAETVEDGKEPLEVKFFNDSYIEIPINQN